MFRDQLSPLLHRNLNLAAEQCEELSKWLWARFEGARTRPLFPKKPVELTPATTFEEFQRLCDGFWEDATAGLQPNSGGRNSDCQPTTGGHTAINRGCRRRRLTNRW